MEYPKSDPNRSGKARISKTVRLTDPKDAFFEKLKSELDSIGMAIDDVDDKVKYLIDPNKMNPKLTALAYIFCKQIQFDRRLIKSKFDDLTDKYHSKYYPASKKELFRMNIFAYIQLLTSEAVVGKSSQYLENLEREENEGEEYDDDF